MRRYEDTRLQPKLWSQSHLVLVTLMPVCLRFHYKISCSVVECGLPPKHFLVPMTINPPCPQEFMVSRILSVVVILLRPLMDEFTLMEVF